MPSRPPSVDRVNADTSGGGHAVAGTVLGGTAGDGWGRAAAYDAYADGLHTYALWYLRDHDAAADAAYCAFVAADRNHTNLQQPEQIQPWLYALLRRECRLRASEGSAAPMPVSGRLRPKPDASGESGVSASLIQLERNLRRAECQSLAWAEAEGLAPAHREVLELTIRHGLDSRGLALVLGLREASAGLAPTRGFGLLADAWRELERSLAAAAVAASGRDNCAQLAELTFGWSGKLSATLRAPLTEHVDGCSRCQHYLHTVIGTPSAPTILPFVAAPRALREILLGELSDVDAASDAGVDLLELGARCGTFGPEGFPTRFDPAQPGSGTTAAAGAGRGPRRRQSAPAPRTRPQRTPSASPTNARPQPVHKSSDSGGNGGGSTVGFTATAAGTAILSGADGSSTVGFTATAAGSAIMNDGRGSAAPSRAERADRAEREAAGEQARTQPPASEMRRRSVPNQPTNTVDATTGRPAPQARPRAFEFDELFRAKGSWADKVLPPDAVGARGAAGAVGAAGATGAKEIWRPDPEPRFVQTSSGRFATRPPALPAADAPGTASAAADAPNVPDTERTRQMSTGPAPAPGTTQLPRVARAGGRNAPGSGPARPPVSPHAPGRPINPSGPKKPGGGAPAGSPAASGSSSSSSASARPRHKARPMRQAVVSAMALGAIGAVAAAAAAMLGVSSNPHTTTGAAGLDGSQSAEGLGSASSTGAPSAPGTGRMSVSVTTGAAGSPTGGLLTGASGLAVGLPSTTALTGSTGAGSGTTPPPTSAASGAFFVSVNQRSADPDSVQILLRDTGTGPLSWSAAPSVPWLVLSQGSGSLAAGQSLVITATATSAAPSGQWTARIVFSPGGIVVTLHGGIPVTSDPTTPTSGGGSASSTPSNPTTPPPTTSAPTTPPSTQPPTTTASTPPATGGSTGGGTSSGQPTASDPTSGSPAPTPTGTAASNPPSTPSA
jgi:DNA-directed RNA polymerase specialized sigma24 family protein